MHDAERLQRIALELADAVDAREHGKLVRLPVIKHSDAAALTNIMNAQLDDAISRRDAEIGERMACRKGCSSCCRSPVLTTEGEVVAIVEWLREPANADVRARFEAAYPKWRDTLGELVGQAGDTRTSEQTTEWCTRVQKRLAMCAFNHEGACSIYPVRPALCRKAHALDTNEHCSGNEGGQVQYYQHPETENVYETHRPMRFALHAALRPSGRLDLLCSAVHRVLGGAAAGRNDPCPCGSGKKFKKCCGAA